MKKGGIIVIILVIILAGAYLGRHKIKAMLGMTPAPVSVQTTSATVSPTSSTSAAAPSDNIYKIKTDPMKGKYVTDFQDMTVYTFDSDKQGVSNCTDACAKKWPPYTSGATAQWTFPTNITVIKRADGSEQFAWKGMPLYYYSGDQKAG